MSIDQTAVATAYLADKTLKIADLATTYGVKPADIAAILRLNGVTIRRGNPNGVSEVGRAKARATRQSKALRTTIYKLVQAHGHDTVMEVLQQTTEGSPEDDSTTE